MNRWLCWSEQVAMLVAHVILVSLQSKLDFGFVNGSRELDLGLGLDNLSGMSKLKIHILQTVIF